MCGQHDIYLNLCSTMNDNNIYKKRKYVIGLHIYIIIIKIWAPNAVITGLTRSPVTLANKPV